MSIGQRIKAQRIREGLTIDDLAYKLGKNRTTIYRYEKGDIENLPLGILDSLANALNTTPAYLMGWESVNNDNYEKYDNIDRTITKHLYKWCEEFETDIFDEEEFKKIIEYGRFLLSMRKTK